MAREIRRAAQLDPANAVMRQVKLYKQGGIASLELEYVALKHVECHNPATVFDILPPEILDLVHAALLDAASRSDEQWAAAVSINSPQPTPRSQSRERLKYQIVLDYFEKSHKTDSKN